MSNMLRLLSEEAPGIQLRTEVFHLLIIDFIQYSACSTCWSVQQACCAENFMSVSVDSSVFLLMIETQMCLGFLSHANKTSNDRQQKVVHIRVFFFQQICLIRCL